MSFQKYRIIDLAIFTVIFFLFEFLCNEAATNWFAGQPFSISLLLALSLLIVMRWDYYSIPVLVIYGAYFVLITNRPGIWYQYIIYILGNLSLIIAMFVMKKIGKDKIRKKWYYTLAYAAGCYLLVEIFRSLGALCLTAFTGVGAYVFVEFITTDALNLTFAIIVLLIARQVNGLFEDQKAYMFRLEKERNKEIN